MEPGAHAVQLHRAYEALERWNERYPDRWVCWEWLEEAILARRQWRLLARRNPNVALRWYQRYRDFARRVPGPLLRQLGL